MSDVVDATDPDAELPPADDLTREEMLESFADLLGLYDPRKPTLTRDADPYTVEYVVEDGTVLLYSVNDDRLEEWDIEEMYRERRESSHQWTRDDRAVGTMITPGIEGVNEARAFAVFESDEYHEEFTFRGTATVNLADYDSWRDAREAVLDAVDGETDASYHVVDFDGSIPPGSVGLQ